MTKKEIIDAVLSDRACEYNPTELAARIDGGNALSAGQVRYLERLIPGCSQLLDDNPATEAAIAEYRTAELRLLISKTGLKKEKLARIANVAVTTFTRMVAGKTKIPESLLVKLRAVDKIING